MRMLSLPTPFRCQFELIDQLHQRIRLVRELPGCGIGLFDHCSVALGHLVHLVDRGVDLRQRIRLVAARHGV